MDAKQMIERKAPLLTPEQFANLGDGMIAYVKAMRSEDVNRLYPQAPHIQPGLTIFALIGADGNNHEVPRRIPQENHPPRRPAGDWRTGQYEHFACPRHARKHAYCTGVPRASNLSSQRRGRD